MLGKAAKDFVQSKLAEVDGVLGVLLAGSSSFGYADSSSDIDLKVFVAKELLSRVERAYDRKKRV